MLFYLKKTIGLEGSGWLPINNETVKTTWNLIKNYKVKLIKSSVLNIVF